MTEKRFNARKNIDNDYFEERLKVELENIVGIVHSDDVTNSVELKKEYYKSRMTENKRYYLGNGKLLTVCDSNKGGSDGFNGLTQYEVVDLLNEQDAEIKRLKKENQGLQFKIMDMLDFVKEKGTVTREEIKKWWNGDVE